MNVNDLNEILKECIVDCNVLGIKPNDIVPYVQVNKRLKRVWARTVHPDDDRYYYGKFVIEFAPKTLKASDKAIKNTMMHEVLHCVDDCFCHTGRWKKLARKISYTYNEKYGEIKRTASNKEMGLKKEDIPIKKEKKINYELYCPKCGDTWGYTTFCQAVKGPWRYSCRKCRVGLKSRGVNGKEILRAV